MKFDFTTYMEKHIKSNDDYKINQEEVLKRFNSELNRWLNVDTYIKEKEKQKIKDVSEHIRKEADVFVVIGIGGSYMGSKAVIEALLPTYNKKNPEIIFLGTNLNPEYVNETLEYIKDKNIFVNVISKSGTTLEPSIAFDIILKLMKSKYEKEELVKRIIITTDKEKGLLREKVEKEGYLSFEVPGNVGGRFSVFTPVGLLPIAVAGIDIDLLLEGVKEGNHYLNEALEYARIRDIMLKDNRYLESITVYNPKLYYFTEWVKQLMAETQGKNKTGIIPITSINTRDLHSIGQYFQQGSPIVFETVIKIENGKDIILDSYKQTLKEINDIAVDKVAQAHYLGHTPSNVVSIPKLEPKSLGCLLQFYMLAAIVGSLYLEQNPFDQPGVEDYKKLIHNELTLK